MLDVFSSESCSPRFFKKAFIPTSAFFIPSGFIVVNRNSSANLTRSVDANRFVLLGLSLSSAVASRISLIRSFLFFSDVIDAVLAV